MWVYDQYPAIRSVWMLKEKNIDWWDVTGELEWASWGVGGEEGGATADCAGNREKSDDATERDWASGLNP